MTTLGAWGEGRSVRRLRKWYIQRLMSLRWQWRHRCQSVWTCEPWYETTERTCRLLCTKRTLQINSWWLKDRAGKDWNAATILRSALATASSRTRISACVTRIATFTLTNKKKGSLRNIAVVAVLVTIYIMSHRPSHSCAIFQRFLNKSFPKL